MLIFYHLQTFGHSKNNSCIMPLTPSDTIKAISNPIKTVSLPSGAYVLSLASSASFYAAAASAPTNVIQLFDKSRLDSVQSLPGHDRGVTTLISPPVFANESSSVFVSCGKDGHVHIWDERAGSMGQMDHASGHKLRIYIGCFTELKEGCYV